jgi:acyl-CoA synthetase (AMP-forming)/AMP-acid ligase II
VLVREPGGRPTKEIIITTRLNVYPSEVESVLREQPSVVDLTVMGLPGNDGGELVVAAAVLLHEAPSTSTVSARTPQPGTTSPGRRITASESTTSTLKRR